MIRYLIDNCTIVYRWLFWPIIGAIVLVAISALTNTEYSGIERVLGFLSGSASVVGGIILCVLWYEKVIFQTLYLFPRAIYWRNKGWATGGWEQFLLHAVQWGLYLTGAYYLVAWVFPAYVHHPTFDMGRVIGIGAVILRQMVSSYARDQVRFSFLDRMQPYVTKIGYERTLELLKPMDVPPELLRPPQLVSMDDHGRDNGGLTLMDKLLRFVGGAVIVIALVGGWRYFLESTRPPALKTWVACKEKLLENWAGAHANQVKPLLDFTNDHAHSFGAESRSDSFDDHDSRGTAVSDAQKLGISESELIQLDQGINKECGPFPRG